VSLTDAVSHLLTAVDELSTASLTPVSDDELLAVWRSIEQGRNRLAPVDHRMIEEVESRNLPHRHACASTAVYANQVLRLEFGEARARVAAAHALGRRRTLTGEALEPIFAATAEALAAGEISARHAAVVVGTVEKLPEEVRAVLDRTVEAGLLDNARVWDPGRLRQHGRDLVQALDQDGQYHEAARRHRDRAVRLIVRADGSGHLEGEVTAELAEFLRTLFDALAKPQPATDGTPDPRSYPRRCHDGLLDGLKRLLGSGQLPASKGVTTTVILTMDADTFATGHGTATTGHGVVIPAEVAKRWAGPQCRIILVLLSTTKGITGYSQVQRFFTEQQRLAMMARDKGCSFPGCDRPGTWADAHHITDFKDTSRTCVDDGALVCDWHHDHFQHLGWTSIMRNGTPHWIPPGWLDPNQTPQRNTRHDRIINQPL